MARMTWAPGPRMALLCEYVVWTSLIAVVTYVLLVTLSPYERTQRIWANPMGALTFFSVVHTWLTAPLSIILALGHLVRRAVTAWRPRRGAKDDRTVRVAVARWPIWPIVYSGQAAFSAAVSDILLLTLASVQLYHHNTHWVLYPWGVMAAVLFAAWSLRAVCHPVSADQTAAIGNSDLEPSDRLWDWFGEAMIAAGFSSLVVVIVMAWRFVPGDPLTAELVPVNFFILAAGMIPIALMVVRRGAVWTWHYIR